MFAQEQPRDPNVVRMIKMRQLATREAAKQCDRIGIGRFTDSPFQVVAIAGGQVEAIDLLERGNLRERALGER